MTLHAVHREPWHPDCPDCRELTDPGIVDAEPWPCPGCQSQSWRKPRPLWRRLLDALRRMR